MARSLAIETSGRVGSIALACGDQLLAEEPFPHGLKHAAGIVPMIERLMSRQGWRSGDLEHLYVSAGPGSFTGLRIGITLAKTLAFATGVKVVAVPTVRVLAENAPAEAQHLVIVLDAKREQIYTARFEREDLRWVQREPAHLDALADVLRRAPRPIHLLGEGLPYHEKFLPKDDPTVVCLPAQTWRARAAMVARIGHELAEAGEFADPDRLTPIYIRRPEAEEKFEAQHQGNP